MKARNKHEDRFFKCPGAWIGNMPGQPYGDPNKGHIIVDPKKAVWAIHFLRKFYQLTGSHIHDEGCGGALGFLIQLETKGKERTETPQPQSIAA